MGRKKENIIEKFIRLNGLDFSGSGSELNGNCVILAGYAHYLGFDTYDKLADELYSFDPDDEIIPTSCSDELERVFEYAVRNNYGKWWHSEESKKTYVF